MELLGYFTVIDLNSDSLVSILEFTHKMDGHMYDGRMGFLAAHGPCFQTRISPMS